MADGNIEINTQTAEAIDKSLRAVVENQSALAASTARSLKEMQGKIDEGKEADPVRREEIAKLAAVVETGQANLESEIKNISADVTKAMTALNRSGGGNAAWGSEAEAKAAQDAYAFAMAKGINDGTIRVGQKIEPDAKAIAEFNAEFPMYARRGDERGPHMTDSFKAALQTGSDPDGGYLVPTETSRRIIEKVYESSPLRELATVETIGGKELEVPRDEGEFGAGWVGETTARPETSTSQLGMSKIVAHEMYAAPAATQNMLEDAAIDIAGWIARKVGQKFGRLENTAFMVGTGVGQPVGLLTPASGTGAGQVERLNSGAAADFTFDGLLDTVFSLKDPYENNATWLINRLGLRNISKLKDLEGRYIWNLNMMQQKGPSLLLGYPVRRAADISAPGAGAVMAAFGDFKEAYTIVDRLGITTLRDPYTNKPYVIFYTRRRVGGAPVNFEAYKLVVGSASANP